MYIVDAPLLLLYAILYVSGPIAVRSLASVVKDPKPVKKIAIIGSGISGLSIAHALTSLSDDRDDLELSLFDARTGLNTQDGGGLQLTGGLTALGKFNRDLQKAVMAAGLPQTKVQSRAKAWKDPSPTTYDTLLEIDIEDRVRKAGGDVTEGLVQDGKVLWYAIMRGKLQEVLLENLPSRVSDKLEFGKKLLEIVPAIDKNGVICKFSDESSVGPFDMVIGCDGVGSSIKDFIENGKIKDGGRGIYSGIRIKFAVKDGDAADAILSAHPTTASLTQYFGDGGYGLSAVYGNGKDNPPTKCALLVLLDDGYFGPFKKKEKQLEDDDSRDENVDWAQDNRKRVEEGRTKMLEQVRSKNLPDFDLAPTISSADRFFELGVYFHNPFSLTGWSREISDGSWAVVVGDAAHAMPPFLGQGANQAIQDAYALAKRICEYNDIVQGRCIGEENENKTLPILLKEYERTRWFPTASITIKSVLLGYLETGGFEGVYAKFRDVFFRAMDFVGVATRVLLDAATPRL